jgi:hypothetical protein
MDKKKLELWHNHSWLLHHDNAPAHTLLRTAASVTNNNMVIIPHPPYSLDLAPCDFTLFPKLKMKVRRHFETVSDIKMDLQAALNSIKGNDFHGAFEVQKI